MRQLCSVGRVSESDLTSTVLLLSWLVCLTLISLGCGSYVKYGAITFFPSSADHCETRRVCVCVCVCLWVCVLEFLWRHVLCVYREETEGRADCSSFLYLMLIFQWIKEFFMKLFSRIIRHTRWRAVVGLMVREASLWPAGVVKWRELLALPASHHWGPLRKTSNPICSSGNN